MPESWYLMAMDMAFVKHFRDNTVCMGCPGRVEGNSPGEGEGRK